MGRYLSLLANGVLFVVCAYLVAGTLNAVLAGLVAPEVSVAAQEAPAPQPRARTWADREVILQRNLFNASLLAPPTAQIEAEQEELEKTQLPLALLGTAASADPRSSWAAVDDLEARKTLIVRNGDTLARGAEVLRIERRRIVLLENGKHRELALDGDDDEPTRSAARPRRARRSALAQRRGQDVAARVREIARNRFEVPREQIEEVVRNPASIFSQVQIQPKYEDGEMIGMQLNEIRPGSVFEQAGLQAGDVIVEVNGIPIDGAEASATILTEFAQSDEVIAVVQNEDGQQTITIPITQE